MNKKVKSYTLNISALVIIYVILSLLISTGTINSYISGIIITIGIAVIMAVSLNLTTGLLGQLALGHAGFMSIGAYTAALITKAMSETSFALSLPVGLIAGGLMAALFGLIIGMRPQSRLSKVPSARGLKA